VMFCLTSGAKVECTSRLADTPLINFMQSPWSWDSAIIILHASHPSFLLPQTLVSGVVVLPKFLVLYTLIHCNQTPKLGIFNTNYTTL